MAQIGDTISFRGSISFCGIESDNPQFLISRMVLFEKTSCQEIYDYEGNWIGWEFYSSYEDEEPFYSI